MWEHCQRRPGSRLRQGVPVTVADGSFEVSAQFAETRVVLIVRGELDRVTARDLRAVIDAVIDGGNFRLVLDLAECDFIDAAGLRVIADGATRADLWGGTLTVRSPSGVVRRLLDLTGLDLTLTARQPSLEKRSPRFEVTGRTSSDGRLSLLGRLGAVPDEAVVAALRLVVALARAAVNAADGVSVSLRRHDVLATVAASDQTISAMDANQYATGEGPCVDASVEGHRFHAGSLATETRWPAFTPRARALGINAILSTPLIVQDRPVGALNIYSRSPEAFAVEDQRLASVFAVEASAVLTAAAEDMTAAQAAGRLREALRTRQVIALAQGMVMERDRVDEDRAYTTLRRFSARTGRPLRERAEDVVASTRWSLPPPDRMPHPASGTVPSGTRDG
jgi:anti-anti-sigma factor